MKYRDPHRPRNPEFTALQKEWYERLDREGFRDLEDSKERLKFYDRRTISFENREIIAEFFRRLDHYLTSEPNIPKRHKEVLELYSQGIYANAISKQVGYCYEHVRTIIKKYQKLLYPP